MIVLETGRLRLRKWKPEDREPFALMNSDPQVVEFLPGPLSRQQSDAYADRIEAHFRQRGFGRFAIELREGARFIGFMGPEVALFEAHFTPCVEIGWRLAPDLWGRGLATEAARAVLQYGFETLRLDEIVAFTVPANLRSRRVMEKAGMVHDLAGDFDHPKLAEGHPLRRHLLYRSR